MQATRMDESSSSVGGGAERSASESAPTPSFTNPDRAQDDTTRIHAASSQSCSTDALHIIFSFLSLVDASSAASCCRRWSSAAAAATVGRHRIELHVGGLAALARARVSRLVGEVDLSSSTLVAADRVESLWSAFPHLTALTCAVDWRMLTDGTAMRFPTTLRSLDVTLLGYDTAGQWSHLDVLLSLAARCPLRRLRVAIPSRAPDGGTPPVHTIERLLRLRDTITDLELDVKNASTNPSCCWSADHIAAFRSLSHLTRLRVAQDNWNRQELAMLAAEPITLEHLKSLDLEHTDPDESCVAALARLPALSALQMRSLSEPTSLEVMSALQTLLIHNCGDAQLSTELAHALARCTRITDLTLSQMRGNSEQVGALVREFLPAMTRLRVLHLTWMPIDITCLSASSHLAGTLEHLNVTHPQPLSSLLLVRTLRRLQWLRLKVDLGSAPVEVAEDDGRTVFMPDLDHLQLTAQGVCTTPVDLSCFFGRLPALRRAELTVVDKSPLHQLTTILMGELVSLKSLVINDDGNNKNACLARVMPLLPRLREFELHLTDPDLSFLSSSSHLAHTLERLKIAAIRMTQRQFVHLQPLVALRYLALDMKFAPPPESASESSSAESHSSETSAEAPVLPLVFPHLRKLHVNFSGGDVPRSRAPAQPFLDFTGLLMPDLRKATIRCGALVQPAPILAAIAHSTRLTRLSLKHLAMSDVVLADTLRSLTHLRSLYVESIALGSLSFLTQLAPTLEELGVHAPYKGAPYLTQNDLHHLRALTRLRTLDISVRMTPEDRPTVDEFDLDEPTFPRDCWPYLHASQASFHD